MASLSVHQVEAVLQSLRNCAQSNDNTATTCSSELNAEYHKGRRDGFKQAARLLDEMLQIQVAAEAKEEKRLNISATYGRT